MRRIPRGPHRFRLCTDTLVARGRQDQDLNGGSPSLSVALHAAAEWLICASQRTQPALPPTARIRRSARIGTAGPAGVNHVQ